MTGSWKAGSSRLNIQAVDAALSAACLGSRRKVLSLSVSRRVRREAEPELLVKEASGCCLCPPAWRAKHRWWKISHWEASTATRTGSPGSAGRAMLVRNYAQGIHTVRLVCWAPAFCWLFQKVVKVVCGESCCSKCSGRKNAAPQRSLLIYTRAGRRGVNSPPSLLCLSK